METVFKKLEFLFSAVAFAEEGDFETAQQMANKEVFAGKVNYKPQEDIHISAAAAHS